MTEWNRDIPWRQGSVVHRDTFPELNLDLQLENGNEVVVVVSHDCDLAQSPEVEPYCEIIVGRIIEQLNGSATHTKNPRTLHLELQSPAGPLPIELIATSKRYISKDVLMRLQLDGSCNLDVVSLMILRRWLGIRYARSAFPDNFDSRLKREGLDKKIAKALKKHGVAITAIFFDVDEGEEVSREDPNDTYTLDIVMLFSTEGDAGAAEAAAETAKKEITKAFKEKLFDEGSNQWRDIELRHFDVISDEALTYRQSITLTQWRLEHISFAEEPPHPVLNQ